MATFASISWFDGDQEASGIFPTPAGSTVDQLLPGPAATWAYQTGGSVDAVWTVRVVMASSPKGLEAAMTGPSVTVEAEFGNACVAGSVGTAAHHGGRKLPEGFGGCAPCELPNGWAGPVERIESVGLSHLDLDALGGVMAALGIKPNAPSFWALAGFVDVNGPHKLAQANASAADLRALNAWWAYSEAHRVFPPRDGSAADVTAQVDEACAALTAILAGDEALLTAGDEFAAKSERLNADTFVRIERGVIVRKSTGAFANHLYVTPSGEIGRAVVTLSSPEGRNASVTLSLADAVEGVSCKDIAQGLWGELAGGHAGIAGSPREASMTEAHLEECVSAMVAKLG